MRKKIEIVQGAPKIEIRTMKYGWLVNAGPDFAIIPATTAPEAHDASLDDFVGGRSVAGAIADASGLLH